MAGVAPRQEGGASERAYRPHIFAVDTRSHFGSEAGVSFRVKRGARTQGEGRRGGVWISARSEVAEKVERTEIHI